MIMYELLSGNRGELIPLNFPRDGESEAVVFGALFCGVVDDALMRFLFYVSSPGSPHSTNVKSNNTKNFLPSERIKGP